MLDMANNDPTFKINGLAVRAIRQQKGITLTELARRADMHKGNLSRIETGRNGTSRDIAKKIADGLRVSVKAISGTPACCPTCGRPVTR